jgi:Pectinacetylesterase
MRATSLRRASMNKRPTATAVVALVLAGLVGACSDDGSSDSAGASATTAATTPTSALSAEEQAEFDTASDFAQCMRDQGLEGFPDPQLSENGFLLVGAPLAFGEEWSTAQEACQYVFEEAAPPDQTGADATADWQRIAPGGDCQCADGSEFAFWERRADPTKVVFYLDGGGACTDAKTCAFAAGDSAAYDWSIQDEETAGDRSGGVFDAARVENPFRDYSFVFVASCTGDAYLGDVTREYSPELTVEHNGFVNGTAALNHLAENYPDATEVVVIGKTVGSIAAPVYGGLAADLLPDADVTVFGAQSGHVPNDPDLNAEFFGELWGAYDNMPDWEVNQGLTARDWGAPRFWIQAGLHDPDLVLARFDYAYDREAAEGAEAMGLDPSKLLEVIDANEAAIEAAGVVLHSYTAPGDDHGILYDDRFYEMEVNGVTLVDWVNALIASESPDDVHCVDCEARR